MTIYDRLQTISIPEKEAEVNAKLRWDSIAKPLGSLGRLEEAVIRLAGISKDANQVSVKKAGLVIMCADHGVVEEGVTQTGYEVTNIVANNFTKGKTSVNAMADTIGVDVFPIDIGMKAAPVNETQLYPMSLVNRKISMGSGNIAKEAAMSVEQCEEALRIGIDTVGELKEKGYDILATGEMGIGNTTPSSALAAVLLNQEAEVVTGKGAGLSSTSLELKINAINRAIDRYHATEFVKSLKNNDLQSNDSTNNYSQNNDSKNKETTNLKSMADGLTKTELPASYGVHLLSQLGGYDIAGLVGVFLGGAIHQVPIIIDGFISSVAALLAATIEPKSRHYMFPSHASKEPAGKLVLDALKMKPFITCDMYLGEGTGAIAVLPILQMAVNVYQKMSTFQEIEIKEYKPFES